MDKIKWFSITEYVDVETGEVITKSLAEREYIIIGKSNKVEIKNGNGIKTHTRECTRSRQLKLII